MRPSSPLSSTGSHKASPTGQPQRTLRICKRRGTAVFAYAGDTLDSKMKSLTQPREVAHVRELLSYGEQIGVTTSLNVRGELELTSEDVSSDGEVVYTALMDAPHPRAHVHFLIRVTESVHTCCWERCRIHLDSRPGALVHVAARMQSTGASFQCRESRWRFQERAPRDVEPVCRKECTPYHRWSCAA